MAPHLKSTHHPPEGVLLLRPPPYTHPLLVPLPLEWSESIPHQNWQTTKYRLLRVSSSSLHLGLFGRLIVGNLSSSSLWNWSSNLCRRSFTTSHFHITLHLRGRHRISDRSSLRNHLGINRNSFHYIVGFRISRCYTTTGEKEIQSLLDVILEFKSLNFQITAGLTTNVESFVHTEQTVSRASI